MHVNLRVRSIKTAYSAIDKPEFVEFRYFSLFEPLSPCLGFLFQLDTLLVPGTSLVDAVFLFLVNLFDNSSAKLALFLPQHVRLSTLLLDRVLVRPAGATTIDRPSSRSKQETQLPW